MRARRGRAVESRKEKKSSVRERVVTGTEEEGVMVNT